MLFIIVKLGGGVKTLALLFCLVLLGYYGAKKIIKIMLALSKRLRIVPLYQ